MSKLQVDDIVNKDDTGGVGFSKGVVVTGISTATSFDGDLTGNVTGNADTATYAPTAGIATNAQGLTGTPNLNVGIITATKFDGDGSELSPTFVASGTISNGNTVVVNSDGTVSAVSGTGSGKPTVGISTDIDSGLINFAATFDSNSNKVVIAFADGGDNYYGKAVVGTITGTDIEFGTPVTFQPHTHTIFNTAVTFDSSNNKVVIAFADSNNSYYGTTVVGTVSGNSITFTGNTSVFSANVQAGEISATFDSNNNKVIIAYRHGGTSQFSGKVAVGTYWSSNDTIQFGTNVSDLSEFHSNTGTGTVIDNVVVTHIPNTDKVVIGYNGSTNFGFRVFVGTIDAVNNTVSFGGKYVVSYSIETYQHNLVYDSTNDKVVIIYSDNGNGKYGTAVVGTISGTAIGLGDPVVFASTNTQDGISAVYDSTNDKVVIGYVDGSSFVTGTVIDATVTGTDIIFGPPVLLETTNNNLTNTGVHALAYDSTNSKVAVAYGSPAKGVVVTPTNLSTNLTKENYIGIAAEAIADGATGKVNIVGGINSSQTGLTTSQKYYVNPTGGLSLDPIIETSNIPGVPVVVAGNSISSTSIIVNETPSPDTSASGSSSGSGGSGTYGDNSVDAHLNRDGTVGVSSVLGWDGNDYNWQPPGGAWQLISTVTASGATTVDFTSGIDSTYRQYVILGSEVQYQSNTTASLYMQFYVNGSIHQSGYRYSNGYFYDNSVGHPVDYMWVETAGGSYLQLTGTSSDKIKNPTIVKVTIDNPSASKSHYTVDWDLTGGDASDGSNTNYKLFGSGALESSTALTNVNGVRLYASIGTINGTFKLYGIK